jgi:hypothetical protein
MMMVQTRPVNMVQVASRIEPCPASSMPKKEPRKAAALKSNREASNRVDRSHSKNPDDWITLMNIHEESLPIG